MIKKVQKDQIAVRIGKLFINDIVVKSVFQDMFLDQNVISEEIASKIRKYVMEATILANKILVNIEHAGGMISGMKNKFLIEYIKIILYICGKERRTLEEKKIRKIMT